MNELTKALIKNIFEVIVNDLKLYDLMKQIDRKSRSSIVAEKVLNNIFKLKYSELMTVY